MAIQAYAVNALPSPATPSNHQFSEFTGIEYLLMDIASAYGLDKKDWDVRLDWALEHENNLMKMVDELRKDPNSNNQYLIEAEEPAILVGACLALEKARKGESTGFPISLDATASGMQLLSVLVGCEKSAKLCNVVPTGHRKDAYTELFVKMRDEATKRGIMTADISRNNLKQAIMTALYGSKAEPKKVFGEGEVLDLFYEILSTEAPGAWALNECLISMWQPYALSHDWVLPDNFHVRTKVMNPEQHLVQFLDTIQAVQVSVNKGSKEGLSLGPNVIHSIDGMIVREINRRCDFDQNKILRLLGDLNAPTYGKSKSRWEDSIVMTLWSHYQESGFLSARILDYLDVQNLGHVNVAKIQELIESMPATPFKVISIHDCFRVLPNHGNALRKQYNQILAELAQSDVLEFILKSITGRPQSVVKISDLSEEIKKADYAIC